MERFKLTNTPWFFNKMDTTVSFSSFYPSYLWSHRWMMDSAAVSSSFGFSNQLHASRSDSVFGRRRKRGTPLEPDQAGVVGGGGRWGGDRNSLWLTRSWKTRMESYKQWNCSSFFCYFHANPCLCRANIDTPKQKQPVFQLQSWLSMQKNQGQGHRSVTEWSGIDLVVQNNPKQ